MASSFRPLRLRKHADYGSVYGASRKHSSASLSFFYRPRPVADAAPTGRTAQDAANARFGITTPRALGPAVLRNRIKRRLRLAARAALPLLPADVDLILHPRAAVATMPFPDLLREMETVCTTVTRRIESNAPNTPLPRRPRSKNGKRA
jgi:ribonuclease P protein component